MYRSFAAGSLLLLASLIWVIVDGRTSEWRDAQRAYRALLAENADPAHATPTMPIALRQVFLPELGTVDRCVSCHVGIDNPDMAGRSAPHTFHPGSHLEQHPPERFGCTACHGGDGRATNYVGTSHVAGPESVSPMASPVAIEARCGTCHTAAHVPGAPHLSNGRRLLAETGCASCHEIPGVTVTRPFGPSLDDVGAKLREDDLATWIANPRAVNPAAKMPHFRLGEGEAEALAAFLATQRRPQLAPADPSASGDPDAGRSLFGVLRCTTCHTLRGKGGTLGPPLDRIGERLSPEWLVAWLTDPQSLFPETRMPRYRLEPQQVTDLAAYLLEEMVGDTAPKDLPRRPRALPAAETVAAGRTAFLARGCMACHSLQGFERPTQVAPSLVGFGSRSVERLLFAGLPEGTHRTLADWTFRKVATPGAGAATDPAATMPDVALTPSEVADVTIALMALRTPAPPAAYLRGAAPAALPARVAPLQGEIGALFDRYRCLTCHTIGGIGGTLANVPLDREGSKVEPAWLEAFLVEPDTIRVAQEERMPKLGITPAEAKTLADYLTMVMRDDRIPLVPPARPPRAASLDEPELVSAGRAAFDELGCRSCHIEGERGGYVGPDLFRSGARLRTGWTYALLTDPGLMAPELAHPGEPLDPATATALTAFLKTLVPAPLPGASPEGGAP